MILTARAAGLDSTGGGADAPSSGDPAMPIQLSYRPVTSLWQEFKTFAFKGSMIDLAVGVVIGAAFGKVITSIVENVITPLIGYVTPGLKFADWHLGRVKIGVLLNDLLSFFLVALAVFIVIVKLVGAVTRKSAPAPGPSEPVTKECPLCLSTIPIKARKCAHCTADLPAEAVA
jgi:large conductance mechanosensitive channel